MDGPPSDPVMPLTEAVIRTAHEITKPSGGGARTFFLLLQRHLTDTERRSAGEVYDYLLRDLLQAVIASSNLTHRESGISHDAFMAGTSPFVRHTLEHYRTVRRNEVRERHEALRPRKH